MGHRENLLAGARQCLAERGYAHTTARDIVAASGTNLASIGYHFGSMEKLLNEAMNQAMEEWGNTLGQILSERIDPTTTGIARFEAIWTQIIASFATHRNLLAASFEAYGQAAHSAQIREFLAEGLQQGREGLAFLFHPELIEGHQQTIQQVGALYQALLSGVWIQWQVDPNHSPSAHDLAQAIMHLKQLT